MSTTTHNIGLRCFLEGIEVPVNGVSVNAQKNGQASGSVVIPFSRAAHGILPRTLLHVFYFDSTQTSSTDKISDIDQRDPTNWKLLTWGEVVRISRQQSVSSDSIVLEFIDGSTYRDSAKIFYGNNSRGSQQYKQAVFMGASVAHRKGKKSGGVDFLLNILQSKPRTIPTLQGITGAFVALTESMTGLLDKNIENKSRGLSDWFAITELRLKLTKQIGVCLSDTTSAIITSDSEFKTMATQQLRGLQGTASFNDLLRLLMDRTFHMKSPVLAPPYIADGAKAKYLALEPVKSGVRHTNAVKQELQDKIDKFKDSLDARSREVRNRAFVDTSGESNTTRDASFDPVADPFQHISSGGSTRADSDAQRVWVNTYSTQVPSVEETSALRRRVTDDATTPVENDNYEEITGIRASSVYLEEAAVVIRTDLMGTTDVSDQTLRDHYARHTLPNFINAYSLLDKAEAALKKRTPPKFRTVEKELALTDRLITELVTPDVWMLPPPACNIIFPSDYRAVSTSDSFLTHPTRYLLYGLRRNGAVNNSECYFAPNTEIITGQVKAEDAAKASEMGASFLMPHEKFTGIIPALGSVGQSTALKRINTEVEKVEPGEAFTAYKSKNPALNRAAHHNYFSSKYSGRTVQVSCRFMPNLIVGLPCAVLTSDNITTGVLPENITSENYVGQIVNLSHQIDQGGASTQVVLDFTRRHNEGLSDFGTFKPRVEIKKILPKGPNGQKLQGVFWAEVYGWRTRNMTVDGAKVPVLYPVIGMGGVVGGTGSHVAVGLRAQSKDVNLGKSGEAAFQNAVFGVNTGKSYNRTPQTGQAFNNNSSQEVDARRFSDTDSNVRLFDEARLATSYYRVIPSFSAANFVRDSNGEGSLPVITGPRVYEGFTYDTIKPFMSPGAICSVQVSAYKIATEPAQNITKDFSFCFEQIARPPWFGKSLLNQNIGEEFYRPLFGCGAMTDPSILAGVQARVDNNVYASSDSPNIFERISTYLADTENRNRVVAEVMNNSATREVVVTDAGGNEMTIPVSVLGGASTHEAIDVLHAVYSGLSTSQGLDVSNFVNDVTKRNIASMVDIFGYSYRSGDPSETGPGGGVIGTRYVQLLEDVYPLEEGFTQEESPDSGVTARNGFHSQAFGDADNLNFLVYDNITEDGETTPRPLNAELDPRKERYNAVRLYAASVLGRVRV